MRIERKFLLDPHLRLYLPLWKLDGTSFRSEDAYGHLCVATGSPWTPRGRTFNGSGQYITITAPPFLSDTQGTIIFRCNGTAGYPLAVEAGGNYFSVKTVALIEIYVGALILRGGIGTVGSTDDLTIAYTSNGSKIRGFVNGVERTFTVTSGTNSGQWFSSCTNATTFNIGGILSGGGDYTGRIKEVLLYNVSKTPSEILDDFLNE